VGLVALSFAAVGLAYILEGLCDVQSRSGRAIWYSVAAMSATALVAADLAVALTGERIPKRGAADGKSRYRRAMARLPAAKR